MIYLDNAATTKPCVSSIAAAAEVMQNNWGNPSSSHAFGINAREVIDAARRDIADALGADENEIFFTSGGTESNNLAIFGAALSRSERHIVTSAVEHSAVSKAMRNLRREHGFNIDYVPMSGGKLDLDALEAAVTDKTSLVSVMLVQNEIGTVFPIADISRIVRRKNPNALIHCDAVQGFGKIKFNVHELGVDLLSVSAHKIHGISGCGALYVKVGARLFARQFGGGQENGLRPGTEATALIAAFGAAVRLSNAALEQNIQKMSALRNYVLSELPKRVCGVRLNTNENCAPHIVSFTLPELDAESTVLAFGRQGICISSGAACKSNEPSREKRGQALEAYGLTDAEIRRTLRVSFCGENTLEDADALLLALSGQTQSIRA